MSCEDEPLEGDFVTGGLTCETAVANTAQAALNFLSVNDDNYTQLCITYRNALQAQIQACGDPDNSLQVAVDTLGDCTNNNQQATGVQGTWLLTSWLGEEPLDLNNDGTASDDFLDEIDCYENETIVFDIDGTAVAMSTSFASFIFDIEVGTTDQFIYTIECEFEDENTNLTWSQSGSLVTIDDGTTVSDFILDGNQLSVFISEGFFASSSDFTATTTQDLTFIYTKQ
tara:strand:- start:171 stop:854 length:684 start_codon:yes stop_codon:yes gene_type:complete